jgi:predicted nucleic acid-binding protein
LAIEVIVNDSSCLIDLRKAGLLTTALALPFRFVVALPLIVTELHGFDDADWNDLRARGLEVIDLNAEQVGRAFGLKALFPGLSAYDCFSLALAESTPRGMLLTGDQQLRKRAEALGVIVHGVLWIADEIEKATVMPFGDLADALARLEADPLVFLPRGEVTKRIEHLRKRARGAK